MDKMIGGMKKGFLGVEEETDVLLDDFTTVSSDQDLVELGVIQKAARVVLKVILIR